MATLQDLIRLDRAGARPAHDEQGRARRPTVPANGQVDLVAVTEAQPPAALVGDLDEHPRPVVAENSIRA